MLVAYSVVYYCYCDCYYYYYYCEYVYAHAHTYEHLRSCVGMGLYCPVLLPLIYGFSGLVLTDASGGILPAGSQIAL